MNRYRMWLVVPVVLAIALLAVLYFYNPETRAIYPICLLTKFTGLQCATCGGLRSVHQLLHGNFTEAWHYNPLILLVMCAVVAEIVRGAIWGWSAKVWSIIAASTLIAMLFFTIARNVIAAL